MPFRNSILAGNTLVRNAIQSQNFVAGSTGWRISKNGDAEFEGVDVRGVFATGGSADDRIVIQEFGGTAFITFEANATQPSAGDAVIQALPIAAAGTDDAQVGLVFSTSPHANDSNRVMQTKMSWREWFVSYTNTGTVDGAYLRINRGSSGGPVNEAYLGYEGGTDRYFRADSSALLASDVNGVRCLNGAGTQTWFPMLVDGRADGSTTTTAIGTNSDTNISGCNLQNTPVIQDRAYMAYVQIDYFRSSTGTQTGNRLELKIWDGAVGGTQLGGTVRWPMAGGDNTNRRVAQGMFLWRAASTQTMANVNLSISTTDVTASQNWTAERNAAFIFNVMEVGNANMIVGL